MFLLNFQRIVIVETGNFRSFTNFIGEVAVELAIVGTAEGGSTGTSLIKVAKFVIENDEFQIFDPCRLER